jgi:hypothetical protein
MSVSVVTGRWGPCCSVDPRGITRTPPDLADAARSGHADVDRSIITVGRSDGADRSDRSDRSDRPPST